jgi:hypothetical protein
MPLPALAVKLNVEVLPGGKCEFVNNPPPASSI